MRHSLCWLGVLIIVLPSVARAEGTDAVSKLELNGDIEVNQLMGIEKDPHYLNNENLNVFTLKAKSVFASRLTAYGELRFRNIGYSSVNSIEGLGDRGVVDPNELEIKEAYMECKGFLLDGLDLKVGKQRMAWGTADTINPTDNLNPLDLEDPLDFKNHLGSDAVKLTYYLGSWKVTGVFLPRFIPSLFPSEVIDNQARRQLTAGLPVGVALGSLDDEVTLPAYDPKNSMEAVKVGWNLFNYDMSVSYFYGRDNLPVVTRTTFTPASYTTWNSQLGLEYPREQVLGYDFSGSVANAGVWGEAACFIPEKLDLDTYLGPVLVKRGTAVASAPYYKWVVGTDYSWDGGWYCNLQFLHGFTVERAETLRNYITAQIEKKFLEDTVKVTLKSGFDVTDVLDHQLGYMPNLEVSYKPIDNTEVILGAIVLEGKDGTTLGEFRELDEAYMKFKYSF
jgi:hypothetical protein